MNLPTSDLRSVLLRARSVLAFLCSPASIPILIITIALTGCGGEIPPAPVQEDPLDGERINGYYTNEEIRYFLEVALGDTAEMWNSEQMPRVIKWMEDIRISLQGQVTPKDSLMVRQTVEELNRTVYGIRLSISDQAPNVKMYFVPQHEFHLVESAAQPGDYSQVWVYMTGALEIYQASILIPTDSTTEQYEHDPAILRNTTVALGLLHNSVNYPESIFYAWWNWNVTLPEIDRKVIEMLYTPEVHPGMTREAVIEAMTTR